MIHDEEKPGGFNVKEGTAPDTVVSQVRKWAPSKGFTLQDYVKKSGNVGDLPQGHSKAPPPVKDG